MQTEAAREAATGSAAETCPTSHGGRVPSLATYTRLIVDWRDRFKLSSLHGSRNKGHGVKIYAIYKKN